MAHNNTVISQLLKLIPRHGFESLAKAHHAGRQLRKTSRWSQFVSLCLGQLAGRHSLRDIESNMNAQYSRLYHLGAQPVARSSLARLNERQPYTMYESLLLSYMLGANSWLQNIASDSKTNCTHWMHH